MGTDPFGAHGHFNGALLKAGGTRGVRLQARGGIAWRSQFRAYATQRTQQIPR